MRVKARTSPLPVIATALPARNRRVAAGMAAAGMRSSPARGGHSACRTAWPACDYCHFHPHSGRQVAANRGAHRLYRARELLCVAGVELGELPEIAQVHEAGDDVVERRAGRAQQNLDVAEHLCGLVGDVVADQFASLRVEAALTGQED